MEVVFLSFGSVRPSDFALALAFSACQESSVKKKPNSERFLRTDKEMGRYTEIKQAATEVVGFRVVKRSNTRKAHAAIRDLIVQHRSLSYKEIAEMLGVSRWLVYSVAVEFGVRRPRGAGSPAGVQGTFCYLSCLRVFFHSGANLHEATLREREGKSRIGERRESPGKGVRPISEKKNPAGFETGRICEM